MRLLASVCSAATALVLFAAAPASAAEGDISAKETAPEPRYDFTLGVSGGLADTGLEFTFRVTEDVAWSFDLGVAWVDEIGVSAGVSLQYFVTDQDFEGFYIGFGGQYAAYVDPDVGVEDDIVDVAHIGAFFGSKWIIDPGFTLDLRIGPSLAYRSETDTVNGAAVTTTTLAPALDTRLVLGWSF